MFWGGGANAQPTAWALFDIRIITLRVLAIVPIIHLWLGRSDLFLLLYIHRWCRRHNNGWCHRNNYRRVAIDRRIKKRVIEERIIMAISKITRMTEMYAKIKPVYTAAMSSCLRAYQTTCQRDYKHQYNLFLHMKIK